MSQLRVLDLSFDGIGDRGAAALIDSPHLNELRTLRLLGNPISEESRGALAQRFGAIIEL
jgi:hypothetical protein